MTNRQILIKRLIQEIQINRVLGKDRLLELVKDIEDNPKDCIDDVDYSATTANLLLVFIDEDIDHEMKIKLAHLTYFYIGIAIRIIDDRSKFNGIPDFMMHRMQKAPELLELFYKKIVLLNNFRSLFYDTLTFLFQNQRTVSLPVQLKSIDPSRVIDSMIMHDIEDYVISIKDLNGRTSDNTALIAINQTLTILNERNLTKDELALGRKMQLLLFHMINNMVLSRNFNFSTPIVPTF